MRLNLNQLEKYNGNVYKEKIHCRNKTLELQDFDYDNESYMEHLRERKRKLENAYIKSVEKDITRMMKTLRQDKNLWN